MNLMCLRCDLASAYLLVRLSGHSNTGWQRAALLRFGDFGELTVHFHRIRWEMRQLRHRCETVLQCPPGRIQSHPRTISRLLRSTEPLIKPGVKLPRPGPARKMRPLHVPGNLTRVHTLRHMLAHVSLSSLRHLCMHATPSCWTFRQINVLP